MPNDFTVDPYDPRKVTVTAGLAASASVIRGFADGSMIEAEYTEDHTSIYKGSDGNARFVLIAARDGEIMIRLSQGSPSNAVLQGFADAKVPIPITVTDKTSNADLFFAAQCMVRKVPKLTKGKEEGENEWAFLFLNGQIKHAGGKVTTF